MRCSIFLLIYLFLTIPSFGQKISTNDIDWQVFLSQHDMLWEKIKPDYYSGAILGNGLLGVNIYADEDQQSYRWDIGRSDVTENRDDNNSILYNKARLPIGHFKLIPRGKVLSEEMKLSLWDATVTGHIRTEAGKISFKTYVDANKNVIVIETAGKNKNNLSWSWVPEQAISPRVAFAYTHSGTPQEYIQNPNLPVELTADENFRYSIQKLQSGWVYVTGWSKTETQNSQRILVTVSYTTNVNKAIEEVQNTLTEYSKRDKTVVEKEHKKWWHTYYPASYASFPEKNIERFYWMQQYKFGCLTRHDKNIIDLMGPWTHKTPWPAIWWNLNIQLTYSPLFTANRLELSEPLWNSMEKNLQNLINNVPNEEWRKDAACIGRSSSYDLVRPLNPDEAESNLYEVGNLTWTLFYYWQYCTYKGDENVLLNKFYPLLKRSIAYYSHIIYKGEDGKFHLPLTASPEYKPAPDCNYDLSLLRWGLLTLLDINKQYKIKDPLEKHWESVLNNLTDYPEDPKEGYMIGQGVKLESSHRHYSHLLMIYPLHLINWEQEENRSKILSSLNHWIGMKGALQGYSYTGSSSIYSMMGDGDMAIKQLNALLEKYIQPNTLYKESGPVIETPLSAATSLQELYLQSWGNKIRVFPAVPTDWKDLSFTNFRAKGAFLISAIRKDYKTSLIQVESLEGGECRIQTGMSVDKIKVYSVFNSKKIKYQILDKEKGLLKINMKKGDTLHISQ